MIRVVSVKEQPEYTETAISYFQEKWTDHNGYYEKYGFNYIGQGYHPWGDHSRIYELKL